MIRSAYWSDTRAPRYSIVLALPLLLLYEALAGALAAPRRGLRNGADVILQLLVEAVVGPRGTVYVTAGVILVCVLWVIRDIRQHGRVRPRYFPLMLAESAVLAVIFGVVVATATAGILSEIDGLVITVGAVQAAAPLSLDPATALMLSLGAGLYEELLFRVLLVTGLAASARALLGVGRVAAGVVATVLGALVFSAFHYVGAYGDPFTLQSFTFRVVAGIAFSALYLVRGFGVTAWTHALYDVGVLLL